jgi:hypothetical protein
MHLQVNVPYLEHDRHCTPSYWNRWRTLDQNYSKGRESLQGVSEQTHRRENLAAMINIGLISNILYSIFGWGGLNCALKRKNNTCHGLGCCSFICYTSAWKRVWNLDTEVFETKLKFVPSWFLSLYIKSFVSVIILQHWLISIGVFACHLSW